MNTIGDCKTCDLVQCKNTIITYYYNTRISPSSVDVARLNRHPTATTRIREFLVEQ